MEDAVNKFFRHDRTAAQDQGNPLSAKRLKLSTAPVKSNRDSYEEAKVALSHEGSDSESDVLENRRAGPESVGSHALPSPVLSPMTRDVCRPHSKKHRFLDKFRSYPFQISPGPSIDAVVDATRTRPLARDIFKARRRAASRQAPKRPGRSRLPMPVRFADRVERPARSKPASLVADELTDFKNLSLEKGPIVSRATEKRFADRLLSVSETYGYVPSYSKTRDEAPVNHDDQIDAILGGKQLWQLELSTAVEESIQAQRKTQISDVQITRDYITNLQLHGVRAPCRPLLLSLSDHMCKRTISTVHANPDAVLAKAADSTPLRRHDFRKVIPKTEWLNDEIVNGVLSWLDQAVNHIGGVDDPKTQTRKCLIMTSFYYKQIKTACKNTQRTLKRKGITKDNLLEVNTILLPICEHSHWTLMVINPSKKTVAHVDSLNPRGTKMVVDLALRWMKDALDERFVSEEWSTIKYDHPAQTNGYDCGVHTICNAICLAVGVDPSEAYKAAEMPALRLQMSAVLVNGGFNGELDLLGF
ncbi:hypothetical protein MY3957_009821 [Beauveria namnaoensis]